MNNNEIAVIMAAGMGTRMRPLTDEIPKPLVSINGQPMIESVICSLRQRGVGKIIIVTGYRNSDFEYLKSKYDDIELIHNPEYQIKNNLSSVFCACDRMKDHDCFICEADLLISDYSIFDRIYDRSCYFGRFVGGHSDDWVFYLDKKERIIRICKGGDDVFNMVGLSYFKRDDTDILVQLIKDSYEKEGNEDLFWDEVVDRNLDKLDLGIQEVNEKQICEFDTIEELAEADPSYLRYLQ